MLAFKARNLICKVQPRLVFNDCKRAMAVVPFKLADIGEGIAEVELMKWFVKEGDNVKSFDRICEVQSDKATVEITSRFAGIITKVHNAEGDIVKVGAPLVDIETGSSAAPVAGEKKAAPAPVPTSAPACAAKSAASAVDNTGENHKVLTTPAVRKIAKENNIKLTEVAGTGPKGRVLKEDILTHLRLLSEGITVPAPSSSSSSTSTTTSPSSATIADVRVPIRGVQRMMVKSMTAALQVPHLTYCEEIQFDALKGLRDDLKAHLAQNPQTKHVKLSYMPLMIKATSLALRQFPQLNATVNADVTEVLQHGHHNIGVAMDTAKGLVVPVLKHVESKSILEIAAELNKVQEDAVQGRLTESQLSGGSFTLSNIGAIGGTYAVPVVVVPQVMIGAMGRLQVLPRYHSKNKKNKKSDEEEELQLLPTTVMNISWSADHRVVDGATVAKFSNLWKKYLENPQLMMSELR